MVSQAITSAARLVERVKAAQDAIRAIQSLRKDVAVLRKSGMATAANALERECNFNEARIKRSLGRMLRGRGKARTSARNRSRTSGGRFS